MSEQNKNKISIDEFEKIVNTAEKDYSNDLAKKIKISIIILAVYCLYMFLPKTIWLIPSSTSNEKLDTSKDPILIENPVNINAVELKHQSDYDKLIKYKSFKNGKTYYIMPLAKYSITARVFEKNTFFYMQWDIDNVSLVDYGFAWGDMAKNEFFGKLYGHSNQDVTGRRLVYSFKDRYMRSLAYKFNYMKRHTSHTHTIPANKNIKKVLYALKKGQTVKLDGYLVDVYDNKYWRFAKTSLSLEDEGYDTPRGGGACEVMYVTRVQVGDKVFE